MFSVAPIDAALEPPGYVFVPGYTRTETLAYTSLAWIAENDGDFPHERPARVGGAAWDEPFANAFLRGAEEYCRAHPEQFRWQGTYLTDFAFTWDAEVQALIDCDYVFPPMIMTSFIAQYRDSGGSAKLFGTDGQAAFLNLIDDADIWDMVGGMLIIRPSRWWNEESEVTQLAKRLLYENHPDEADEIIRSGSSYQIVYSIYIMLELIKGAVEAAGAEHFDSQALYDAAQSFSLTVDGCRHSFSEMKRTSADSLAMYELRAEGKDLYRLHSEWYPIVVEP